MRFLIGLICGAVVMLLLAQTTGTADRDWLRRVPVLLDGLAVQLGDALELPPRPPARVPDLSASSKPSVSTSDSDFAQPFPLEGTGDPLATQDPAAAGAGGVAADEPATRPIPRPPDPSPVDAAVDADADSDADADWSQIAAGWLEEQPAPPLVSEQPVWVPFHSEMSASGFAERLSESLDHPFRVDRRGPGRYQVVFGYADESQRLAVLSEAAAATGLPL